MVQHGNVRRERQAGTHYMQLSARWQCGFVRLRENQLFVRRDLPLLDTLHNVAQERFEIRIGGFELRPADDERRAKHYNLRA